MVKTKQHYLATGVSVQALNTYLTWGAQLGWEVGATFPENGGNSVSVVWIEVDPVGKPIGLPSWKNYISR